MHPHPECTALAPLMLEHSESLPQFQKGEGSDHRSPSDLTLSPGARLRPNTPRVQASRVICLAHTHRLSRKLHTRGPQPCAPSWLEFLAPLCPGCSLPRTLLARCCPCAICSGGTSWVSLRAPPKRTCGRLRSALPWPTSTEFPSLAPRPSPPSPPPIHSRGKGLWCERRLPGSKVYAKAPSSGKWQATEQCRQDGKCDRQSTYLAKFTTT